MSTPAHTPPPLAPSARYDRLSVLLHWAMALLILGQLAVGLWMVDLPKDDSGLRAQWFNNHKAMGLVLLLLIALRTARLTTRPAIAPAPGLPMQQRLATGTHHLLYLLMVLAPLSGLMGSVWSKYPIKFWGLALPRLAEPWEAGKAAMSSIHSTSTTVLMVLVALHLAGVAYHQFIRRDGLLQRMR